MGLFLMVLGFMWWWPLGLIILAALIANGRIGYRRRLQFAGSGPMGDWNQMDRIGEKADRVPAKTDGLRDRVRGNWWGQPSSGNRAFDDYRAETLRRLEDEQREFKEFLKRLRVARDRRNPDQGPREAIPKSVQAVGYILRRAAAAQPHRVLGAQRDLVAGRMRVSQLAF
jgi:hypothetical protein